MSDPLELNRILEDLAAGRINADEAAGRIASLNEPTTPSAAPNLSVESLYNTPPARAIFEPEAPAAADDPEPIAEPQPAIDPEPQPVGEAEPVAEPAVDPDDGPAVAADQPEEPTEQPKQSASSTEQPAAPAGEKPLFTFDMEDVTATAGEVFSHAGDFAKTAFQKLGEFASSVIPEAPVPPGTTEQDKPAGPTRPTGNRGVERLVLRSVGRRVRLIGDPKVPTISVDGPHTLRRQGVTIEVNTEGELGLNLDSFSVIRPPRSVEDLRVLGLGKELVIRVNPAIPVDAEVTGSKLTTVEVPYLGKIRVSAGAASLSGVVEINDALMQAGSASLSGPLSSGRSQVRVESGNLSVHLTAGANVTIRATTQLGRVSWPGDLSGEIDEFVVGNGSAKLELGVVMGRAVVRTDS